MYGFHERKIITKLIAVFEASGIITACKGVWGSLIILAANPHQESCTGIHAFVCKLYVSYRRCVDIIEDLSDLCGPRFIIFVDTQSGCYRIRVRESYQNKLDFFTSSETKKTYIKFYLSALRILWYFTPLLYSHYEKSGQLFLLIRSMLSASILLIFQLYVMQMLSLIICYSTLTILVHFFITFLVFVKFLPNIVCLLN